MDALKIIGSQNLSGEIVISSSKNAILPILSSILLFQGSVELKDIPNLKDLLTLRTVLEKMGVCCQEIEENLSVAPLKIKKHWIFQVPSQIETSVHYDLVRTMRASILVLGPLLARFGEAEVALPGGCAIGSRPIDIHLEHLKLMGAEIEVIGGIVKAKAKKLKGVHHYFRFPSVGATENIMMAAVYASGTTVIHNGAQEPEIYDLGHFLKQAGVDIHGLGTSTITIKGRDDLLRQCQYTPMKDRVEAATFICAALMTQSELKLEGVPKASLKGFLDLLQSHGALFEWGKTTQDAESLEFVNEDQSSLFIHSSTLTPMRIQTAPYPGFPTDMQAQLMALLTQVEGLSTIEESIFENRFMHVPELNRLGAQITLQGNVALIKGKTPLMGAPVMCSDLRASAALVLGALVAKGETVVKRIYHLDRGYESMEKKLQTVGANIIRVKE
jgi:UDP-N-acetylglucosamine 1-carboxyvinyltransferase